VWYRAISLHYAHAMHVFEVWASSSPLGYLFAKFCFCRALHCCISTWRKILYSVTHPVYL